MNYLAQRRQALLRSLKDGKDSVDAILITAPVNVTYLTGFAGDSSYFFISPKAAVLISDNRFEVQIKEECPEVGKGGALDLHIRPHDKTTLEAAAEVIVKAKAKTVGVEANRITVGELSALQALAADVTFVPLTNTVEALRVIKDPSEVERIRDAVRVAERAYRMFTATLRPADTEKDLSDVLDGYIRRAGGRAPSFPVIVAVGDRGALPHAPPTDKPLGEASKFLADWGADLGYKSDITRVMRSPFHATPSRRNRFERVGFNLEEVYSVVLAAQNAALAAIRPGVKAADVDAAARKVIHAGRLRNNPGAKLGEYFTHGLGHGLGLEVHEAPRVRANSDDVLEAGMVITIEPGVYIPEWGGVRIEDDVLVTRDGCTLLTSLPRELSAGG